MQAIWVDWRRDKDGRKCMKKRIYTDEWVKEIKEKYQNRNSCYMPPRYFLATSKSLNTLRDNVEKWTSDFPEEKFHKLRGKLRDTKQFFQTYNELAIGQYFIKLGYKVKYEEKVSEFIEKTGYNLECTDKIKELTPDWLVYSKGNIPSFFVEVASIMKSDEYFSKLQKWSYLRCLLEKIHIGVSLGFDAPFENEPTQQESKNTVKEVEKWLKEEEIYVGSIKIVNNIKFEVVSINKNDKNVSPMGPFNLSYVNTDKIKSKIEEKRIKYQELKSYDLPFVIATIGTFLTGLKYQHFEEIAKNLINSKNYGVVSAFLWGEGNSDKLEFKVIFNPLANSPLPSDSFSI